MSEKIYIPFDRGLYDDIVAMSGGKVDLPNLVHEQIITLIELNIDGLGKEWFGDNLNRFISKHLPWMRDDGNSQDSQTANDGALAWGPIRVPERSKVRMRYGGKYHYATVSNGRILYKDKAYKPSEWASKIANGTNRNAWRDLEFQSIGQSDFYLADLLRADI